MTLSFTPEQLALRGKAIAFGKEELAGDLVQSDRDAVFPRDHWDRCGAAGVLGAQVPREYGGSGLDTVTTVVWLEALGYGCRDNGLMLGVGGQIWSVQEPILIYGNEEQKQRFLPKLSSGEWIGCHGVSEPDSGSDALAMKTRAEKVDGGYLLNGTKSWIGMAPVADVAVVLANTNPELGKWGVSAFLVESSREGMERSEPKAKAGTRTNPLGDLTFTDCFVPEENRLGSEGIGLSFFTRTIQWERAFIHAPHLGAMQHLLQRCRSWATERRQFGKSIGEFQAVSHRIANMRLRQETARLLMYRVAQLRDQGHDAQIECAMAKLHVGESLLASATDAVRIHGARGIVQEYEVERELRDSIGAVVYAGTSDIQRNLIYDLMDRESGL